MAFPISFAILLRFFLHILCCLFTLDVCVQEFLPQVKLFVAFDHVQANGFPNIALIERDSAIQELSHVNSTDVQLLCNDS